MDVLKESNQLVNLIQSGILLGWVDVSVHLGKWIAPLEQVTGRHLDKCPLPNFYFFWMALAQVAHGSTQPSGIPDCYSQMPLKEIIFVQQYLLSGTIGSEGKSLCSTTLPHLKAINHRFPPQSEFYQHKDAVSDIQSNIKVSKICFHWHTFLPHDARRPDGKRGKRTDTWLHHFLTQPWGPVYIISAKTFDTVWVIDQVWRGEHFLLVHSFSKETFRSCISFREECMPVTNSTGHCAMKNEVL